jgi:hypothetical protein
VAVFAGGIFIEIAEKHGVVGLPRGILHTPDHLKVKSVNVGSHDTNDVRPAGLQASGDCIGLVVEGQHSAAVTPFLSSTSTGQSR